MQHSETGLTVSKSNGASDTEKGLKRLQQLTPEEVNANLKALAKQQAVWLETAKFKKPVVIAMSEASLATMRRAYDMATVPPPKNLCAALLAEMDAILKSRSRSSDGNIIKIQSYTKRMQKFPADCVIAACQKYRPAPDDWFPSWAELQRDIEEFMGDRLRIHKAMQEAEILSNDDMQEAKKKRIQKLSSEISHRKKMLKQNEVYGEEPFTGYFQITRKSIIDLEQELKIIEGN